jgi:hypothetical protein
VQARQAGWYGAVSGRGKSSRHLTKPPPAERAARASNAAVLVGIEELDRRCGLVDVVDVDDAGDISRRPVYGSVGSLTSWTVNLWVYISHHGALRHPRGG